MNLASPPPQERFPAEAPYRTLRITTPVSIAILVILAIGIFARLMNYSSGHDEQIHVAAARLIFHDHLYTALGYNHLPNLPLLLGSIYTLSGTEHLLLVGRFLIFACWIATAAILALIVRHHRQPFYLACLAVILLVGNAFLGPAGMLVTNNFLPVPFALLGLHLFVVAVDRPDPKPLLVVLAGMSVAFAVGLKVAYIFLIPPFALAALLVPPALSLGRRLTRVTLPLLIGGLTGGAPTLFYLLTSTESFFAHTLRYFTGPHKAYWQATTEPKVMALSGKILLAEELWLAGSTLLCACLVGFLALAIAMRDGGRRLLAWPILLTAALILGGAITSFAPTPSFPQYFAPPVPFLIALAILLYARTEADDRARATPLLMAVGLLAIAAATPRLVADLPRLAAPGKWAGVSAHREGERMQKAMADAGLGGRVATLSPIIPLEGGRTIYPEFAAGPFIYRVADLISPADRRWYRLVSERQLAGFLAASPPDAILVGDEGALDNGFISFATSHGYRAVPLKDPALTVFIRPAPAGAGASPTAQ